jgi:hypothetical protein
MGNAMSAMSMMMIMMMMVRDKFFVSSMYLLYINKMFLMLIAQTSSHNGGFGQLLTHNPGDHVPERRVTVAASGKNNAY